MNHRLKPLLTAALSLLLALGLAACALPSPVPIEDGAASTASDFTPSDTSASQSGVNYVVETSDMAGNTIRLSAYPSSIVVLDPADCEILYAIGAGDAVVGRTIECDYPDETNLIPFVTVDGKTDADLVLLRQPQLVIMGVEDAANAELVSALSSAGVTLVVTNATDVNNMYGAISLLGTVTNHTAEANSLVSSLITSLAEAQAKISEHSETVYLELTPLDDGLTTVGGGTIFSSLVSLLGYHNEFEDQQGYLSITQDQVVGRSPGVIITASQSGAPAEDPDATPDPNAEAALTGPDEILARSEWANVSAVKSGRVYYIDAALLTRAGPRVAQGLAALYTALYENTQP
ncbi:MAG: ABC transporter substrate-binding protein [Clostridiales bacterium]|nr:ABC transporter substrate-binding protein [Clostridiales bacterium]